MASGHCLSSKDAPKGEGWSEKKTRPRSSVVLSTRERARPLLACPTRDTVSACGRDQSAKPGAGGLSIAFLRRSAAIDFGFSPSVLQYTACSIHRNLQMSLKALVSLVAFNVPRSAATATAGHPSGKSQRPACRSSIAWSVCSLIVVEKYVSPCPPGYTSALAAAISASLVVRFLSDIQGSFRFLRLGRILLQKPLL